MIVGIWIEGILRPSQEILRISLFEEVWSPRATSISDGLVLPTKITYSSSKMFSLQTISSGMSSLSAVQASLMFYTGRVLSLLSSNALKLTFFPLCLFLLPHNCSIVKRNALYAFQWCGIWIAAKLSKNIHIYFIFPRSYPAPPRINCLLDDNLLSFHHS